MTQSLCMLPRNALPPRGSITRCTNRQPPPRFPRHSAGGLHRGGRRWRRCRTVVSAMLARPEFLGLQPTLYVCRWGRRRGEVTACNRSSQCTHRQAQKGSGTLRAGKAGGTAGGGLRAAHSKRPSYHGAEAPPAPAGSPPAHNCPFSANLRLEL